MKLKDYVKQLKKLESKDVDDVIRGYVEYITEDICDDNTIWKGIKPNYRASNKTLFKYFKEDKLNFKLNLDSYDAPKCSMELVYEKRYPNDPYKGCFDNDEERMEQLRKIVQILKGRRKNANKRKRNK